MTVQLIKDENIFETKEQQLSSISLSTCIEKQLLISPDSQKVLRFASDSSSVTDGCLQYPLIGESPVLYPEAVRRAWNAGALELEYYSDPLLQYVLLSQIKQRGEINAPLDSIPAQKHKYRFREFCRSLSGLVLDVGCDSPSHSMQLFPECCEYIGLDPYANEGDFRTIGLGEILPFSPASIDHIAFNTSLDHILDYQTALEEAARVLKANGNIIIATYAWTERATLLTDNIHFHHFREFEILGALSERFVVTDILRYEDPKHARHRYGLYVAAAKK